MSVSFSSSMIVGIPVDKEDLIITESSTIATPCACDPTAKGAFCYLCGSQLSKDVEQYTPTPLGKLVGIRPTDDEDDVYDWLLDGNGGKWDVYTTYSVVEEDEVHRILGKRIGGYEIRDTHCVGIGFTDLGVIFHELTADLIECGITQEVGVYMLSACG